ncbi:MAG: TerB N-terminal domain-containing protein [Magnetococcales bacterium]|nr:TerB N-terminal domain-containing protein [Magnetococcales bacterium]
MDLIQWIGIGVLLGVVWLIWDITRKKNSMTHASVSLRGQTDDVMTEKSEVDNHNFIIDSKKIRGKGHCGRWVVTGESVRIHDYIIPNGMVYVGEWMESVGVNDYTSQSEPSLINPNLGIDKQNHGQQNEPLSYWPSYSNISPSSRSNFLRFLADGARDPTIEIGYVFIYYYGLERRLLIDLSTINDLDERKQLIHEVIRLLSIFRINNSFRGYATNLLFFLSWHDDNFASKISVDSDLSDYFTARRIWIRLGQTVADGKPIHADLALAWLRNNPDTKFRTPAIRLENDFNLLFTFKFLQKFPNGLMLKPNKSKLILRYQPASSSLLGQEFTADTLLPDLGKISSPLKILREISDWATEELEPYSRLIGRDPEKGKTLMGLAFLPVVVLKKMANPEPLYSFLKFVVEALKGKRISIIKASDLLMFMEREKQDKINRNEAVCLAQLLEKFKVGLEPDVRFSPMGIRLDGPICLFRMKEKGGQIASTTYATAAAILHLAALMAGADGTIVDQEQWQIEQYLKHQVELEPFERERLDAYLAWLIAAQPGLKGMEKRFAMLEKDKACAMGRFLANIAIVDGHVHPAEIKLLEKIYKLIRLDPTRVHTDLHDLQVACHGNGKVLPMKGDEDNFTIIPGQPPREFAIPPPRFESAQSKGEIQLDLARIQHIQAQTATVQNLLLDVFATDDDNLFQPIVKNERSSSLPTVVGLDGIHLQLFHDLRETVTMQRDRFDSLCRSLGLMSEGAIEVINDTAMQLVGDPVLEGDDPVEMNIQIAQEMMQ